MDPMTDDLNWTERAALVSPMLGTFATNLAGVFTAAEADALLAELDAAKTRYTAPERVWHAAPARPNLDSRRMWLMLDFLLRVVAPRWLDRAGLEDAAYHLERLEVLTGFPQWIGEVPEDAVAAIGRVVDAVRRKHAETKPIMMSQRTLAPLYAEAERIATSVAPAAIAAALGDAACDVDPFTLLMVEVITRGVIAGAARIIVHRWLAEHPMHSTGALRARLTVVAAPLREKLIPFIGQLASVAVA